MIFFTLKKKKVVTSLNFLKPNIIKLWIKFDNNLGCKLKLQLNSVFFIKCEF